MKDESFLKYLAKRNAATQDAINVILLVLAIILILWIIFH